MQIKSNLSAGQQIGLKPLGIKVAKLEVIVLQANKGKTFVVGDKRKYLDHVLKYVKTTPEEVQTSQKIVSSTARALGNIHDVGRAQGNTAYNRCMYVCMYLIYYSLFQKVKISYNEAQFWHNHGTIQSIVINADF